MSAEQQTVDQKNTERQIAQPQNSEERVALQLTPSTASTEPTTIEKLHGLPWSIASNATNTVFVQYTFFGSIFVLFLSALGLSKSQMGFLLSLLPFFGLIALFVAPATERFGYKRTYIVFFGVRNLAAVGLLFTPVVLNLYGSTVALRYVAGVVALFAVLRAVGVTASFPWVQEYVPNSVRGKYTASNNMVTTVAGFISVAIGGAVLARLAGLTGFMALIGVGVVFGLISVALATQIPGGAPRKIDRSKPKEARDLSTAVRDRNMLLYLLGAGFITLATVPLNSFVPLFMGEEVGLSESQIVWLQTGALIGTLLSSYLWGWAADRYGSLPVAQYGLTLRAMLPFLWMLMPRGNPVSLYVAMAIAFLQGVADMGWGIGSARLMYVNIVPTAKRRDYMAVYYAWIGVAAGISQITSGFVLDWTAGLSGQFWFFTIDPYFPLFVVGITLPVASFLMLRMIKAETTVGMGKFAGIFLRGNPFLAMSSLVRFHVSRDEESAVRVMEQLGHSKSPLTVEELLSALDDPRFNVRFEAVISIARMAPDPRLIERLEEMLLGRELALSAVAAWALGRMHDPLAIDSLRVTLDSDYRSIQAASARALGSLNDVDIAPELHNRMAMETDKGLKMSFASALGKFQYAESTPYLLGLFDEIENPGARMEIALDLARMIGDEANFIRLFRGVSSDAETTLAQAVADIQKRLDKNRHARAIELATISSERMAHGAFKEGAQALGELLEVLPSEGYSETSRQILEVCAAQFTSGDEPGMEYLLLALHTLQKTRN